MKRIDKIIEEIIREELEKEIQDNRILMSEFFNLLFWKDYKGSYLNENDKSNIFKEIEEATRIWNYDGEESIRLSIEKILPFVNKIREQIGLKKLTTYLYTGTLMERTPEVDKQLILKELEKNGK